MGKPSSLQIAETVAGIDRQPATIFQALALYPRAAPISAKNWARHKNKALRDAGLRAGDPVAVQGIGGLGHLGIQFERHVGFRTVAIGRGREKEKLAKDLGAHAYIDGTVEDAGAALQRMGGARAILASGTSSSAMGKLSPPPLAQFDPHGETLSVPSRPKLRP